MVNYAIISINPIDKSIATKHFFRQSTVYIGFVVSKNFLFYTKIKNLFFMKTQTMYEVAEKLDY